MTRARIATLALAATLSLGLSLGAAGCSASAPAESTASSPAAPSATPAAGTVITGTGYRFSVPEGWGDPGPIEGFDPDSLAVDGSDADGFSDNVNVILSPAGKITPDQVESQGVTELKGSGATDVTVQPRVTVAGSESSHLTAALESGGASYVIDQFYVSDASQTYIVTFSFSPTVTDVERAAVTGPVLASWVFTS